MTMDLNPTFYSQFALGFQFMPESVKGIIVFFKLCLEYFLATWSLPLEVYLRWGWGTRALSAYQVCFLIALASVGGSAFGLFAALFVLGAAGIGCWHFFEARRYEARWLARPEMPWRVSYTWGEPVVWMWLAQRCQRWKALSRWISETTIFRFLEPATGLLGIPLLLLPFTRPLGVILLVTGAALLAKRHLIHLRIVDATRDRRDAVRIGELLSSVSDAERRNPESGELFEVRLAVLPARETNTTVSAPEVIPTGTLTARVTEEADDLGRPKVECPGCACAVRCPTDYEGCTLKCPKCGSGFVVESPLEDVG
jgi:hypothetical protein